MKAGSFIKAGVAAVALGVCGGFAADVSAATVTQLIGGGGRVFISDEDGESLINRVGASNIIDVGDSIRGALTFDQFRLNNNPQVPLIHQAGNSELGGIFQILVTSKTVNPAGGYFFTFAPDPAFTAQYGAGAMVVLWEDPGLSHFQIHTAGSQAASEASVTDGNLFMTLGIVDQSNGWFGKGSDDINSIVNPSDRLGESWFALDRINNGGVGGSLLLVELSNIAGSGEFIGSSQVGATFPGSPWQLSSESSAEFQVIPTPSAALGGLLLMGAMLRRRRA